MLTVPSSFIREFTEGQMRKVKFTREPLGEDLDISFSWEAEHFPVSRVYRLFLVCYVNCGKITIRLENEFSVGQGIVETHPDFNRVMSFGTVVDVLIDILTKDTPERIVADLVEQYDEKMDERRAKG